MVTIRGTLKRCCLTVRHIETLSRTEYQSHNRAIFHLVPRFTLSSPTSVLHVLVEPVLLACAWTRISSIVLIFPLQTAQLTSHQRPMRLLYVRRVVAAVSFAYQTRTEFSHIRKSSSPDFCRPFYQPFLRKLASHAPHTLLDTLSPNHPHTTPERPPPDPSPIESAQFARPPATAPAHPKPYT